MKLVLDGHEYSSPILDLYRVTIGEARTIKRCTGLTLADWRLGLLTWGREDPDVLAGLVYLLRSRAGETVDWYELEQINAQDVVDGLTVEESDQSEMNRVLGATPADDESEPAITESPS